MFHKYLLFSSRKSLLGLRHSLIDKYRKQLFLKRKWKHYFDAEILIIDRSNETIITKFKSLPKIKILIIRPNSLLRRLPDLPQCRILLCSNTPIETLPKLPRLTYLDASYCYLTEIKNLPLIKIIHCENNKIIHLDNIHTCKRLYCDDNLLSELPNLPQCNILSVSNNKLRKIPYLSRCKKIVASNNQLFHTIYLNNECKLQYRGRTKIEIIRFFLLQQKLFYLLVLYNRFHFKIYGKEIENISNLLGYIKYAKDNRQNLEKIKEITRKYLEDIHDAKLSNENDFILLKSFLQY